MSMKNNVWRQSVLLIQSVATTLQPMSKKRMFLEIKKSPRPYSRALKNSPEKLESFLVSGFIFCA